MSDADALAFDPLVQAMGTDAVKRPLVDPLSFAFWGVTGTAAVAFCVAAHFTGARVIGLSTAALYFGALIAIGLLLRHCRCVRTGAFVEGIAQLKLTLPVFGLLALALAGTNLPYRDAELMAIDRVLFPIDWLAVSTAMTANKPIAVLLNLSYSAIVWQGFIVIFALVVAGKLRRMRVFLLAWVMCLFFVLAIFPLVPALGFYLHMGVPPDAMPNVIKQVAWQHIDSLQPIRDGVLRDIPISLYSGVVTFPSFHAGASILYAWAFYGVAPLRVPAFVLNGAMLISSMPIGGHYIIDIVAGAFLAVVALKLAQKVAGMLRGPADEDGNFQIWRVPRSFRPSAHRFNQSHRLHP